ncbi:MAG TPA: thiamine diphosphokinase [Candidatus Ozemobacteraceae bacterium]|nr:thiamine diphosphokinase [Candidatus Ozemobacteraceae bacterium]
MVLGGTAGMEPTPGPWSSITAVDGGGNLLQRLCMPATMVVGDGDLITPEAAAFHEAAGALFQRHPCDKNETDFELALAALDSMPGDEIHILGMVGGRSDMSLGNILVLGGHTGRGLFTFDLPDGCGGVMGPGELEIDMPAGTPAALLAVTSAASGISSSGVRWPLEHETLELHKARGVSNIVTEPPWRLTLRTGALLWLLSGRTCSEIHFSWKSFAKTPNR